MCEVRRGLGLSNAEPFALGLWLDAESAEELSSPANLAELKRLLHKNNFYVFTINAFPYGKFHNTAVKDKVYMPDWSSECRFNFTCTVADILSELLPDSITGSISTVPGGYREHIASSAKKLHSIAANLSLCADHLAFLHKNRGRKIILAVEMEPDCIWETPREFCEFRNKFLTSGNCRDFIGVCYDTSHQELIEGEPGKGLALLQAESVPIAKIQLSAAVKADLKSSSAADITAEFANFADPVYLHQCRIFNNDRKFTARFRDIPDVLTEPELLVKAGAETLVSHFHIPLYTDKISANFASAKNELNAVIKMLGETPSISSNLEIETYTYHHLPEEIKTSTPEQMIVKEYQVICCELN